MKSIILVGISLTLIFLCNAFVPSNGFSLSSRRQSSERHILAVPSSSLNAEVEDVESDYYSSDFDFLDLNKPLESEARNLIYNQNTLAEDESKFNLTMMAPKKSEIELLIEYYEQEATRFLDDDHKQAVHEAMLAYEEARGYAFYSNRTEEQIAADRRRALASQPNFALERVIISVYMERSQTLASLNSIDSEGVSVYREWLAKAKAKGPKIDPLYTIKSKLAHKWHGMEPWVSVMTRYLEQTMMTGRILYPKQVLARRFPRARPALVLLPDGEERLIMPPKPRVLQGGIRPVKAPEWPQSIVLEEDCPLLCLADDEDAEQYLKDTAAANPNSNSNVNSNTGQSFAPLQAPSVRNWLKSEEELKENPFHVDLAPAITSTSTAIPSLPVSSGDNGSRGAARGVFAVDDEDMFVASALASENNEHEYFVVL